MKRLLLAVALIATGCSVLCPAAQQAGGSGVTVVEGATVIDGVSNQPIRDAVLVIEGDTIRSIGKRGSVSVPANARKINAAGKTILPAMINLHGHIGMVEGMESKPENFSRDRVQRDANSYLYYGITHMVSLGTDREAMPGFLADQRAGRAGGARLYSGGKGFAAKGGWEPVGIKELNRPTTPQEARQLVQRELQKHPDFLKIWEDDRLGELPKFTPDVYGAIIEEAHRHNVKVLVHMFYLEDAKELVRRGVDALAHSVRDKEVDAEFLQLAKDKGITQIAGLVGHQRNLAYAEGAAFLSDPGLPVLFPSIALKTLGSKEYQGKLAGDPNLARTRGQYELAVKNIAKIAAAGISIGIGTDSGGVGSFQGLWEHREMELLVKAGLTPMQAIQAATINGAKFLRAEKKYGSLEPGKIADFIVLNADPLADITNSRKIDAVWMNGKPVDRKALGTYRAGS